MTNRARRPNLVYIKILSKTSEKTLKERYKLKKIRRIVKCHVTINDPIETFTNSEV